MANIEAPRADVTRNERGEVVVSVELREASAMADPALLLWEEGRAWVAAIRDRSDPASPAVLLPHLPRTAGEWLRDVRPYDPSESPGGPLEGDTRLPGLRYALVVEVVGEAPVNGYFARVTPLPPRAAGAAR